MDSFDNWIHGWLMLGGWATEAVFKLILAGVLGGLVFRDARMPLICNVDGAVHRVAADFPTLLVRQVAEPVRWSAVMRCLLAADISRCVEVGPGRVLSGLMRQLDRSVETVNAAAML